MENRATSRSGRTRSGFWLLLFASVCLASPLLGMADASGASGDESTHSAPAARPNLLLISVDTLRADHTSAYGYHRNTTPLLSRLAAEGMAFEVAYAPAAATGPSHATLFTGRFPLSHGLVKNGLDLTRDVPTLAEVLERAGYQTSAIVSSFVLSKRFGFDRGFATYQDDFDIAGASTSLEEWEGHGVAAGFDRRANATTKRALRWLWLERELDRPFFLFLHYFDPHSPYDPPEEFGRRFRALAPDEVLGAPGRLQDLYVREEIARYDAEIAFTDREIGRFLAELERQGLMDDTLVILTSDHGEGLLDHGVWTHSLDVHEESVRIPLVMRLPGRVPAGLRPREPVELADMMPTILGLLGLDAGDRAFDGRDLSPFLLGEAKLASQHPVVVHRRHFDPGIADGKRVEGEQWGIRVGDLKLIRHSAGDRHELYDLARDPGERQNLYTSSPEEGARLAKILDDWRSRHGGESRPRRIPLDVRQALEALGYAE